jgi:hypothetical protein
MALLRRRQKTAMFEQKMWSRGRSVVQEYARMAFSMASSLEKWETTDRSFA